jgi:hypothetical protein
MSETLWQELIAYNADYSNAIWVRKELEAWQPNLVETAMQLLTYLGITPT